MSGRRGRGRSTLIITALAALGLALPAAAQDVQRLSGDAVAIYNLAGRVELVAGGGSDVVVRVERGGRDGGQLTLETGSLDGRTTLRVRYPSDEIVYPAMGRGSSTSLRVSDAGTFSDGRSDEGNRVRVRGSGDGLEAWADLVVEIPSGRSVEAYVATGQAEARGVTGDLRIDTGSGSVSAANVTGALVIDTGSGAVDLADIRGSVLVDTGSGAVEAARLNGEEIHLDTGSGGIRVAGVEARAIRIDTGSGRIVVTGVRAPLVHIDSGSGAIDVELLADVNELLVDTGSGSVTVRVPSDVGADLQVETGSGSIDVDVPLEVRVLRRTELGGRIGDGDGRITIDTGSGSVRITRGS